MGNYILIVTPDPLLRSLFRDVLVRERQGDTVETASAFEEAPIVEACRPVDILIVEEAVPGMDSLAFIERVQARYPEVRVILVTAADRDEMAERSYRRSVSFALFTKPFSIDAFLQHVDHVLARKAPSRVTAERGLRTSPIIVREKQSPDGGDRHLVPRLRCAMGLC